MSNTNLKIAVIGGDGTAPEVTREALKSSRPHRSSKNLRFS
jgi:hypothetical protein